MNFRNLSAWSIRNPVVPIVLFLGLLLAGLISFGGMKVQNDPDIEFPAVAVTISQPGAAPSEIETQITQRVESAVRSISRVQNISSTAQEGSSRNFIEFEIGVDPDQAVNDVKNAVDQIRGDLPDGILEPFVQKIDIAGGPIAFFSISAPDMTIEQLSWFVDDTIAKTLLGVEGMASVSRRGGVDREIRVILDPAKMQALGVTASQVNGAVRQVNLDAAGGQAEIAGSRQSVRVLGNAETAQALAATQISLGGGRTIRLDEVAQVSDGFGEQKSIAKQKGKQVVVFALERAKGASDVSVFDGALEKMEMLKKENPGIEFTQLFNSVGYTKDQYRSSMAALIEGALLAVVVVFLFLRDWRATLISAIAIPLSAIPSFYFLDLLGITLNTMSLLALGLVAGVLVDDAIVEIENIVRHMRMGKTAYQASIDAADEIGLPVVATTFSIVAVFLPVALMPGISGQFFRNFGLTVVVSVLISLAVARMISPMIAAYFLKAKGEADHAEGWAYDRYEDLLRWSLVNRWKMVGIGTAIFGATIGMFFVVPSQFFPDINVDYSRVTIETVPGTTVAQTEAIADRANAIVSAQPEVDVALVRVGEGDGNIFVTLKPDRKRTSLEFERDVAPLLQAIPDARISFASQQGGGGGTGRDISIMLSGSDPELINRTAAQLTEELKKVPGVVAPRVNADLRRPEIIIRPYPDLAAQMGITTTMLSQTIRIATLGEIDQNAGRFSLSDRQIPIRVMLPQQSRRDLTTIENLPVPMANGGSVPLSRVAEISFGSGPTTIQRYNQNRRVLVGADLADGAVQGDVMERIRQQTILGKLPNGVSNAPVGQDEWQAEMIQNFIVAVIAGVLLVFAVLVLLYHRFIAPLVNMGSLLLAPFGGILLLWAVGMPLSMPVFIGTLMLLGIVGKNSILLIDFALVEIEKGVPKFEAIIDAGRKRAQPIVMTTVAMVAGMVPIALSVSGDGAFRQPMGVVVIGGLIMSTVLTLALVPAGFSLADDIEKSLGKFFKKYLLADQTIAPPKTAGAASARPEAEPAE